MRSCTGTISEAWRAKTREHGKNRALQKSGAPVPSGSSMPVSVLLTYPLEVLDDNADGSSRPSSHAVFISILLFGSSPLQKNSIYTVCKAPALVPRKRPGLAISCSFARVKKSSLVIGCGYVPEGLCDPIFSPLRTT